MDQSGQDQDERGRELGGVVTIGLCETLTDRQTDRQTVFNTKSEYVVRIPCLIIPNSLKQHQVSMSKNNSGHTETLRF